jgi:NAD(P)H-hydrate repair Nnr-like enzyme with NAD(P)H-hydrate dehydratase domain
MEHTYWHRQTPTEPLFPDLLWSRPENKRHAGKLLIAGGNAHGFAAPANAYDEAGKAGIGTVRVLLPDSLRLTVGRILEAGEYAPRTPSGSFSRQALAEMLDMGSWADGVLLAGDFGRNSETAVLLEQFAATYDGPLIVTQDALEYFTKASLPLLNREKSLLVASFAQLQKIAMSARSASALTFDMDFLRLVDALHDFSGQYPTAIITKHLDTIFVAVDGQVSTTKLTADLPVWRVRAAAHAAVWWLQNPTKPFEALTTAVTEIT